MSVISDQLWYIKSAIQSQMSEDNLNEFWIYRLALNLLGYASIIVPAWFIIRTLRNKGYLAKIESWSYNGDLLYRLLALCMVERSDQSKDTQASAAPSASPTSQSSMRRAATLALCFVGLQASYLTWGVLQEKIMTKEYKRLDGTESDMFKDSQFCVFINRISAFALAAIYCCINARSQPFHSAPLYKYSYCSFSNILSSWCQYEALKFVTFPTQVLGKACKIIPVMLMGKVVSKKTYPLHQYVTAFFISAGVSIFLLSRGMDSHRKSVVESTTLSGFILMAAYLTFDSFTSNWQGALFSQYRMSSMQMMCGVNIFSSLLTLVSLVEQGTFFESLNFMLGHQKFIVDLLTLSLCSATGQLFIFYTIEQFGAVTFTIIMTIRQALAILLSCLIYGHYVGAFGGLGVAVTFVAIFVRTYMNQTRKPRVIQTSAGLSKV